MDHAYLSEVETGKVSPSVDTLTKLCRFYGCEAWEAVLGMTRAEFIATLPVPAASPFRDELDALLKNHGEETVRALLQAAAELPDPNEFRAAVRIWRAMKEKD